MKKHSPTIDAVKILHRRYIGDDEERKASLQMERINTDVARMIYDLRKEAGLTQKELSARVGTTQSVISRLEDADYDGHSLSMLNRIAASLNRRLAVSIVAEKAEGETPVEGGDSRRKLKQGPRKVAPPELEERARRGSRRKSERALRKVANVEPEDRDRM